METSICNWRIHWVDFRIPSRLRCRWRCPNHPFRLLTHLLLCSCRHQNHWEFCSVHPQIIHIQLLGYPHSRKPPYSFKDHATMLHPFPNQHQSTLGPEQWWYLYWHLSSSMFRQTQLAQSPQLFSNILCNPISKTSWICGPSGEINSYM